MSTGIYRGNTNIEEVPGAKLKMKRGQAAVLTRPFEGNISGLTAFLSAHPILSTDYEYPSMCLDEIDAEEAGPEAKVSLTYYGLPIVNPSNPNDLQSDAMWEPRSVQLATDNTADGEWLVNYYSPTVTYRYAISSKFSTPQYENFSENPSDITIMDSHPAAGNTVVSGYKIQGKFLYSIFSVCTSFKRNQKGNIYNYQETWAVILQKPKDSNTTRTLSVDSASIPSPNV